MEGDEVGTFGRGGFAHHQETVGDHVGDEDAGYAQMDVSSGCGFGDRNGGLSSLDDESTDAGESARGRRANGRRSNEDVEREVHPTGANTSLGMSELSHERHRTRPRHGQCRALVVDPISVIRAGVRAVPTRLHTIVISYPVAATSTSRLAITARSEPLEMPMKNM